MFYRERQTWRCAHCLVHGTAVWAVRDGPNGPRVSVAPRIKMVTDDHSRFATTVVLFMNATNDCLHGRRIYICRIRRLELDDLDVRWMIVLPLGVGFNRYG